MNRSPIAILAVLAGLVLTAAARAEDAPLQTAPAAGVPSQGAPLRDAPVVMASHHAVYKLTLLSAKGMGAPEAASGVIDFDFAGSRCEGFTSNLRQLLEIQPTEGDSKLNDVRNDTYEDGAGKQLAFTDKSKVDDGTPSDVTGEARRGADGAVTVDLKTPAGHASFGPNVLFPVQHMSRIIEAARHGDKILPADVFDGSDTGTKLFHTLTVIGAALDAAPDDPAGKAEALKGLRRWPVVISYFGSDKDQPDYTLSGELYEDGILRALKLDYGSFVLAGALDQLTVRPQSACPPAK